MDLGKPTTPWLDDPDLLAALDRRPPDVEEVRAAAVRVWRKRTETPGGPDLSPHEEVAAGRWLRELGEDVVLALGLAGLSGRYAFFANLSGKIGWFSQRGCRVCPVGPPDAPWFQSPFRIRPMSRQSVTGAYLEELRGRVLAARGSSYEELFDRDLCVQMTFVLAPNRSTRLDVDNMAKTMCDALSGTVYRDDTQIQHLDVMKLRMTGDSEEWVHVSVRPTAVASHLDVFDPNTHHRFGVNKI